MRSLSASFPVWFLSCLLLTACASGPSKPQYGNHTFMHGAGRFGLASLRNLDQLPATGAVVIAAPLKIVNGSGSPLRVLALVEEATR